MARAEAQAGVGPLLGPYVRPSRGTLVPFPRGVSGKPHRGRDRVPRKNVVRAQCIHALVSKLRRPTVDPANGQARAGHGCKLLMIVAERAKMLRDAVVAYQLAAERAALRSCRRPRPRRPARARGRSRQSFVTEGDHDNEEPPGQAGALLTPRTRAL